MDGAKRVYEQNQGNFLKFFAGLANKQNKIIKY